jgi:hypothetical protein
MHHWNEQLHFMHSAVRIFKLHRFLKYWKEDELPTPLFTSHPHIVWLLSIGSSSMMNLLLICMFGVNDYYRC